MDIKKESHVAAAGEATPMQLEAINAQAHGKLSKEQVYVFSLRLCDDQVDRDFERFDTQALPQLAKLFIGKTGIVDHRWSSDSQVARIFQTQVVQEAGVSYIKAWAYIRRGAAGDEVIADIEAGIKKEVSVGCAMGQVLCSVCGKPYGSCGHQKGEYYDGQLCCAILKDPVDAYEFSFVAVPAQREAGVIKGLVGGKKLKALAEEFGAQAEYRSLSRQAQLGREYEAKLRQDVVRLCLSLDLGVEEPVLQELAKSAGGETLLALQKGLEEKLHQQLPLPTQLPQAGKAMPEFESGFMI